MSNKTTLAKVYMWGSLIGHVSWDEKGELASFEYEQDFLNAPVEPSPLKMSKKAGVFSFRDLDKKTFTSSMEIK